MPQSQLQLDTLSPSTQVIRVRLFASLREAMGWDELLVSPSRAPATPFALWQQLQLARGWRQVQDAMEDEPRMESDGDDLPKGVQVAINQRFASSHTLLRDGDELAFLPPITGG
ncbi:MAG: MoaD/ThiS family protein [Cyanobacteriota bacterium]|nr:MoaD/ThiS family protein [Cyanobacteriota bacterium]